MKKLLWGLTASFLLVTAISLEAGEKHYLIPLGSPKEGFLGKPASFQEISPIRERYAVSNPVLVAPPAPTPITSTGQLEPIPEPYSEPAFPSHAESEFQAVELYPYVIYEDLHELHPFAVKRIVAVKDPRPVQGVCGNCPPPCVYVMICVPPTGNYKLEIKRKDFSKVEYDYGKYEVEITSKNGIVTVDYDD